MAVLTVTLAMRRPWGMERPLWLTLGALLLAAFAAFATIGATAEGLAQRVLVGGEIVWLLVVADRLRRPATPRAGGRPHA